MQGAIKCFVRKDCKIATGFDIVLKAFGGVLASIETRIRDRKLSTRERQEERALRLEAFETMLGLLVDQVPSANGAKINRW